MMLKVITNKSGVHTNPAINHSKKSRERTTAGRLFGVFFVLLGVSLFPSPITKKNALLALPIIKRSVPAVTCTPRPIKSATPVTIRHSSSKHQLDPFVPLTWEKGTCGTIVIKGNLGAITLKTEPNENITIKLDGSGHVTRTKHCIIVHSRGPKAATGSLVVPQGMHVIVESGRADVTLCQMHGSLKINAGHVRLNGDGKITRLSVKAGVADVQLQGILGATQVQCGQGQVTLGYQFEGREILDPSAITDPNHMGSIPTPSVSGLSLYTPPVRINVHMAKGQCHMFFPSAAKVDHGRPDIATSLPPCKPKECDFKVSLYTGEDVSVAFGLANQFPLNHTPST